MVVTNSNDNSGILAPSYSNLTLTPSFNNQVFAKIASIMQETGWISKGGKVDMGRTKYDYTTEAQFIAELRPLFIRFGLLVIPTCVRELTVNEKRSGDSVSYLTTAVFGYTFYDVDSGHSVYAEMVGQGSDSTDKGAYKLATGVYKYLLRQTFMIGSGDDPEATDEDAQPTNRKQSRNPESVETTTVPEKRDRDPEEYKQRVRNELEGWNLEDAEVVFKKHKIKMDNLPTNSKTLRYLYEFGRELKAGKSVLDAANSLDEKMSSK